MNEPFFKKKFFIKVMNDTSLKYYRLMNELLTPVSRSEQIMTHEWHITGSRKRFVSSKT